MRNPDRIDPFLEELGNLWKQVPDWRFGQFICNTLGYLGTDPFFVEDDRMIKILKKYFEPMESEVCKDGG